LIRPCGDGVVSNVVRVKDVLGWYTQYTGAPTQFFKPGCTEKVCVDSK
jgi:hypothetical protein